MTNMFASFKLISKLPAHYLSVNSPKETYIPTVKSVSENQEDVIIGKPTHVYEILCADDIAYHAFRLNDMNMRAIGIDRRIKS